MKKIETLQKLVNGGVVAVIRGENIEDALAKSKACLAGGISAIEVTYTVPGATEAIKTLRETFKDEMTIGAGTVLDSETARIAILAGADFIVSPAFDSQTAILCNRYHVPYTPGCMTTTEMIKALEHGVDLIKLFPGSNFKPSFIKDIRGPLPNISIMPTGGVNLENAHEWIEAGAVAVGVGGGLTKGSSEEIIERAKKYVEIVKGAKK
ncbi:MAG: bifunctional 2-keto-4-hydroxyglutarate aldolase/2-keto-3-deoxy-6-phosphogluconate aldolase [Lachnospirales bacterium]